MFHYSVLNKENCQHSGSGTDPVVKMSQTLKFRLAGRISGSNEPQLLCRTGVRAGQQDRKSTRLNSSHGYISYAVFCLKKKKKKTKITIGITIETHDSV